MKTTVYSTDLASYKLFQPPRQHTDVIILHGNIDQPADSDELDADRRYHRKIRINADDITQSVPGMPATVLTIDSARSINTFIQESIDKHHDLMVHCHAGESRTGAVLELAFFTYKLSCIHVQRWRSGRNISERIESVTNENFYTFYRPNRLWHQIFSNLHSS
jgi:protein-tyrosine phosphatase